MRLMILLTVFMLSACGGVPNKQASSQTKNFLVSYQLL
jgi:starvation-inducible outer membrane lipoprotein